MDSYGSEDVGVFDLSEGFTAFVPGVDGGADRGFEIGAGGECAVADRLARPDPEQRLDQVHPQPGAGGEVHRDPRVLGQPRLDRRVIVGGLTQFGRAAVRRINQLALAVDVSHSSDPTGIETAAASDRPVFTTHGGARALWYIPRLKSDDALYVSPVPRNVSSAGACSLVVALEVYG